MGGGESIEADLAAAVGDLDRLVRRLRTLSPKAWETRRGSAQAALARLVAISAELEGRRLEPPKVADHVLPDAIAVVGADVLEGLARAADGSRARTVRTVISEALIGSR